MTAEYLLPMRWDSDDDLPELTAYLAELSSAIPVLVVDGSDPELFSRHAQAWPFVRHLAPDGRGVNGKALGVMTGVRASSADYLVVADDDVRYSAAALEDLLDRVSRVDFVRPQNVFPADPPWHARWDTGRTLWNRAWGGDFSGTVAVRRATLVRAGGYDTGVLFENLELERTIRAVGGQVDIALDLYVLRRPPTLRRFIEQRLRQAYDDWAQPLRMAGELLILPVGVMAVLRRHFAFVGAAILLVVAVGEWGRQRSGGRRVWPPTAALWTPAWLLERGCTVWAAIILRARGGVRYRDARVVRAASSVRRLRRERS